MIKGNHMTDISKEAVEVLARIIGGRSPNNTEHDQTRAADTLLALSARVEELEELLSCFEGMRWREGEPDRVYGSEWFIAETKSREKVVLRALYDGHSYDYKTADETYLAKDHVIAWMQFPDSQFIPFDPEKVEAERRGRLQGLDEAIAAVRTENQRRIDLAPRLRLPALADELIPVLEALKGETTNG